VYAVWFPLRDDLYNFLDYASIRVSIGVEDGGGAGGTPEKIPEKIFFRAINNVKFGLFSGKNHVKFGNFVNFYSSRYVPNVAKRSI